MNTTVQLRIDKGTKVKAQKVLEELGLDLSSGIKLFLTQVIRSKSIPFVARTVNGYTPAFEKKLLKEEKWMKKHAKGFTSVEAFFEDLNK